MKCNIIKDLLPNYIEGVTSEKSNIEIKKHLKECEECCEIFEIMKKEIVLEEYKKELKIK